MERSQLQAVIDDPASTEQEKAAAQAALDSQADPIPIHEQTSWMLQQLGRERIEDLTEADYEKFCVAHCVKQTDPIVREFRYWIAPGDSMLELIGMTRAEWWTAIRNQTITANREDAQAHARRKLKELERRP
jgi:hypothetical protein